MKRFFQGLAFALGAVLLVVAGMAAANARQTPADDRPAGNGPSDPAATTRAPVGTIQPEAPGSTYVAIAPCRLFDTRSVGGAMDEAQRSFRVSGALASQGGSNTCGIPSSATSVTVNLTGLAVGTDRGFVRGWAFGEPPAQATLLNFAPALNASNAVEVPLCTGTCSSDLTLRTFGGAANLVGDAVGYHVPDLHARIGSDGTIYSGSDRVVSASHPREGRYVVTFDRDLEGCSVATSIDGGQYFASGSPAGNQVVVDTWQLVSGAPSALDLWFFLTVTC